MALSLEQFVKHLEDSGILTGDSLKEFIPPRASPRDTGDGKTQVAGLDTTRHPVEMVSWNDAADFCARLSQQENLLPFYSRAGEMVTQRNGTGYRLPTEAEWEYSCRAGTTTNYWIGDGDEYVWQAGWIESNSAARTHPAGELKANPFGLVDVHGNLWEWVQDGWERNYYAEFQGRLALDPLGSKDAGSRRVLRGGGWQNPAPFSLVSHRHADEPTLRGDYIGFRVALVLGAVKNVESTKPGAEHDDDFQKWMKDVTAMFVDDQVPAVAKKLQELNKGFDGKVKHKVEYGVVTELQFVTDNVTDISPVRALAGLKVLDCRGSEWNKGMLVDLSPLKGMSLTYLQCSGTNVMDLSPLAGMPLINLTVDFKPERDSEVLRSIKTLETINDKPVAEFWKEVEAQPAGKK